MRVHKISNVNKALDFIASKGVKLVSIGAEGERGHAYGHGSSVKVLHVSPMGTCCEWSGAAACGCALLSLLPWRRHARSRQCILMIHFLSSSI